MQGNHPAMVVGVALVVSLSVPSVADAFCGFYVSSADEELVNPASTVVLMRDGTRTVLSMQNQYDGPAEDFAIVVPVPVVLSEETVATLEHQVFEEINTYSQPRLVEYFQQDPCYLPPPPAPGMAYLSNGGYDTPSDVPDTPSVRVEAAFAVGEYDIEILSADESTALVDYLNANNYRIPASAGDVLAGYIANGLYFFVARVDVERIVAWEDDIAVLSPLRFHYDSEEFSLPVRLGMVNTPESQEMVVHILSPHGRYEPANYPSVFAPTNLQVDAGIRDEFGAFYTWLMEETWSRSPGAFVTEYVWDPTWCDPCLTTALGPQHFADFGADVLPRPVGEWVHTRMRARLLPTITEDIVFQPAQAVHGGRGTPVGETFPTQMVEASSSNEFQARYFILNPWEGEVECEEPNFSDWAGDEREPTAPVNEEASDGDLVLSSILAFSDHWVGLSSNWYEDGWYREDAYDPGVGVDQPTIDRVLRRYLAVFTDCDVPEDEDPRASFTIQPDGSITDITVGTSDAATCLSRALIHVSFPEFTGDPVRVRDQPLQYESAE